MRKWQATTISLSTLGLLLTVHPSRANLNATQGMPARCQTLSFWAVQPEANPDPVKKACNKKLDRSACTIQEAFNRMYSVTDASGKQAYRLEFADEVDQNSANYYIQLLNQSPAIQEINRMRIEARVLSGHPNPCEPNLIYLGDKKVFGLGSVFVDSTRFTLGSETYTNFISAEDAAFAGVAMLTKDSLIQANYFDIVVAHELAHALTQDLYGLETFTRFFKKSVSRDGHMASAVTDQTIALAEGIAEGYEAYFGEKLHGRHRVYPTPTLNAVFRETNTAADFFEERGWKGYLFGALPFVVKRFASTLLDLPSFTSEFLMLERQETIRENHFALQGSMNNLLHQYDLVVSTASDPELDAVVGYEPENYDALYSKEGVIAHLVYKMLKAGLHRELFEVIAHTKPESAHQLVTQILRRIPASKLEPVMPAFKALFTDAGRIATRDYVKRAVQWRKAEITTPMYQAAKAELNKRLAALQLPSSLPAPRELWVEFQTSSFARSKLYGKMDRVNLFTASPDRLLSFITSVQRHQFQKDPYRDEILKLLLRTRSAPNVTAANLIPTLRNQITFANSERAQMLWAVVTGINAGSRCFSQHYLSK